MLKLASYSLSALSSFVVCLPMLAEPCFATFVVMSGNDPRPDQQNVLIDNDLIGATIQGNTNQSGTQVDISSASQFLASSGAGLEARDVLDINSSQVAIDDSISVSLADPNLAFSSLSFNAFNGGNVGAGGTLTITVNGFESDGTPVTTSLTLDSEGGALDVETGSNFFTVVAIDGQRITSVEISPDAGSSFAGLRQVRIGGIVPEPATWLLACGVIVVLGTRRGLNRT